MKTINRLNILLLSLTLATFQSCLPDSFTKFEESAPVETEAPTNSGGTTPTIPGAGTSSCTGTAAECYGPSDVRYEDKVFDLDNPGAGGNFGPTIIGNSVPVSQLNFSLKSVLPAGLGFNPNSGEFFGTPIDFYNDDIEVHVTHPNTGKTFVRNFNLQSSRQMVSISYEIPLNQKVIITLDDPELATTVFNTTQSIVTTNGSKAKIDYIDPITKELFTTVTKAGAFNINDDIDNNAFFVVSKAKISKAVLAIDLGLAGATQVFNFKSDPDLTSLTETQKSQILDFTTDPTDKVLESDPTGLNTEFSVCDDPNNVACNGNSFGSLIIESNKQQAEKSIMIKVNTLSGGSLNSILTYRVLPFSAPKSISKVVYPQKPYQKLIIKLEDEDTAAKFTQGGYISNERGAKAFVDFVSVDQLFVTIDTTSTFYFESGDKIDNEINFFFEEAVLPSSDTDSSITYVFPVGSGSVDPDGAPAPTTDQKKKNLFLRPDFYFPDGKTKLFEDDTTEESQVRFTITPNPSTKESNISYSSNLAGSYTFDFCDTNANARYDSGVDIKNQPQASCVGDYIPADQPIFGDNPNVDGTLFSYSYCDGDGDRVYDFTLPTNDTIATNKSACGLAGSDWHTAGTLNLLPNTEITATLEPQIFQASVKNALGSEHQFIFKMSFDSPPSSLSMNKYLLIPVSKTSNFEIGDYISSSAPTDSAIDCRSEELGLSLKKFGGTFSGITGADALIQNEDFWKCAVGIVTDIYDSTRTTPTDNTLTYHQGATNNKYLGVKVIKGRFQKNMSVDNVKIFSSEKAKINQDPLPYSNSFIVDSASALNTFLDTNADEIFDTVLDFDPNTAANLSFGQAIAAFRIRAGVDLYRLLVRITPNGTSCNLPDIAATGGSCRFITSDTHKLVAQDTGTVHASDISISFIEAESLFISAAGPDWGSGEELTANPTDTDIDGSGDNYTFEALLTRPLNAVIMDHPDTANPQNYELFVRNGTATKDKFLMDANPFSGSKYYFTGGSKNTEDPANSPYGVESVGSVAAGVGIQANQIKSSNVIYLYKDDPVSITGHVADSTNTNFVVSPDLPSGLLLDPLTGEIRGAPKGKSDPRVYAISATNPYGTTTSYVTIEVMEYFGIDLFASNSEPFSYILHKEGQTNENTQCRILKKQIERSQSAATFDEVKRFKKLVDIGCFLDAGEKDLFEKGIEIALRIPSNTCEYVMHEPYQFYAFKPGRTKSQSGGPKVILNHVSGEKGTLEDSFENTEVWNIQTDNAGTPESIIETDGANKSAFFAYTADQINSHYQTTACNDRGSGNNQLAGFQRTNYPGTTAQLPDIAGGSGDGIETFEHINGAAVSDIFGNSLLDKKADAAKFLCSFNYSQEVGSDTITGPQCDTGSISIKTATWNVGGGHCFVPGIGDFNISDPRVFSRIKDNTNDTGPCVNFSLDGTGLSCTAIDATTPADVATCQAISNSKACFDNGVCQLGTDSQTISSQAEICHIPAFVTISVDNTESGEEIISCGGKHNNCMSGPAVENEGFAGIADGALVEQIINVVKEDGFDSLGGETFQYSPARNSFFGDGNEVGVALNRDVRSTIYLANYLGHLETDVFTADGEVDDPNFGPLCAFENVSTDARHQATQYDLDTLIRGLGNSANGDPTTGYSGIADPDVIQQPLFGSRPYYGYKCIDSADNVVARIRLVARDWNKTFKPSDHLSFVSPDLGKCTDGSVGTADITVGANQEGNCDDGRDDAEKSLMDNNYKTIFDNKLYNDKFDWDDFGLAEGANNSSCYDLSMTNSSNNLISGKACFGQCIRDSATGACVGVAAECHARTAANCLGTAIAPTGCILSNFPAFNY